MAAMTLWFGQATKQDHWYLLAGDSGPATFSPIDISLLPGPQPVVAPFPTIVTSTATGTEWANALLYSGRVLANTTTYTLIDPQRAWGIVHNLQVKSDGGQNLYVDGVVHVDLQLGAFSNEASAIILDGVKRANVIVGGGNDVIDIRMVKDFPDTVDSSVGWSDDFRIHTGAGDDVVKLSGVDLDAKIAAGDQTYIQYINQIEPLYSTGTGQRSYTDLGSGNDKFVGYNSNDYVLGGTDTGTSTATYTDSAPSGYAYAIGGYKVSGIGAIISSIFDIFNVGAGDKVLYKINIATGEATAVGKVGLDSKFLNPVDVESLALNPLDGMLYGFANQGKNVGLFKIDPNTAATTFIGGNSASYKSTEQDMTFGSDGTLYFASEGQLMKVSTTTGNITKIGNKTLKSVDIEGLAIDPTTGKMYGLYDEGIKTSIVQIDIATGKILSTFKVSGVSKLADIEGMSFDKNGNLYAEDRITGVIYEIDLATKSATVVSKTLGMVSQTGDGFEAFAVDGTTHKVLTGITTTGGDLITTGAGADHIFYGAGDGVDTVTDFNKAEDILHITGYTANQVQVDEVNGNTYIRFLDASPDGFVDNALIALTGVTGFNAASISYTSFDEFVTI